MISNPSPEQRAFFLELEQAKYSLLVDAAAGSGKTSTIVHGANLVPTNQNIKFLAFNKNIQQELERRLPPHVQTRTFHSDGFSVWRRFAGKSVRCDANKCSAILKDMLKWSEFELYQSFVLRLVSSAKNSGIGTALAPDHPDAWFSIITHHNMILDSKDADEGIAIAHAREVLKRSVAQSGHLVDFDDMLYMPLLKDLSFDRCNVVFVDEAQDTNGVQRALLKKMVAAPPYGRLIAVGDPNQAIYGFRGADSDAMDLLEKEFSMLRLPLSVSFRCSQAVVQEAQKYCK